MAQKEDKWITVRLRDELATSLEDLVENARDEFGVRRFKSKSEAVTQALREYFRKHKEVLGFS